MRKQTLELIPPEGGWGYAVSLGVTLIFIVGFSHFHSLGILYGGVLAEGGAASGGLTLMAAVLTFAFSISGVLSNVMFKLFSFRRVGFVGASLFSVGWFLNSLMITPPLWLLMISVGVLQGLGSGFIMCMCLTSFNTYFSRRRMSVMAICKMIVGLGNMLCPILIRLSMEKYGFRGTMLLMTGVSLHGILGVLLMHPVKWHQKKQHQIKDKDYDCSHGDEEKTLFEKNILSPLMEYNHEKDSEMTKKPCEKDENTTSTEELPTTPEYERARALSIISFGQTVLPPLDTKSSKNNVWKSFIELFDMNLFKDPIFCNICFGISLGIFTDITFFLLLPLQLADRGYTLGEVAWCVAVVSGTDLFSRGFIGLLGHFIHFTSRNLFYGGIVATALARIVYLEYCVGVGGFWITIVMLGVLGLLRSPLVVAATVIYAEYIPQKFAAAFGLSTLVGGIVNSSLSPLFGILKDATGSFPITLHILNSLTLLCIIPWTVEFIITRKHKPTS